MELLKSKVKNLLKTKLREPSFWLKFAAYALPALFLVYVLYWNFLPFGYEKTFTIQVGQPGDTKGEFYLEPSKDLSEPKVAEDGTTYRELNGIAYAVFEPKAVLRNADITVSVEGDGVSLIPPYIDFDPDAIDWDYEWDFTQGIPKNVISANDEYTVDSTRFDGTTKLELTNSANLFENGPFTVYAEWTPEDITNNAQQIVGHYNWELWQNATNVEFRVGRMNNATGPAYSVKYPVTNAEIFFGTKHSAVAVYNPGENGYIELYVDGNFADRKYIGTDTIWKDYGNNKMGLSFGKSEHGTATPFLGNIYNIRFSSIPYTTSKQEATYSMQDREIPLIIFDSVKNGILTKINLYAVQK